MKKISNRAFAVLGLTAACASVLLWSKQDASTTAQPGQGSASGALSAASNASPHRAGSLPPASLRAVAYVAPTPRNAAQAKLGGGQLLEAVQSFAQSQAAQNTAGAAQPGSAAYSAATAAAQIAALDRAGVPMRWRDGGKVKVNVDLALSDREIQNPDLLQRATSQLRDTLLTAGLEAQQIGGSPSIEASIPLDRLEWVAGLKPVARVGLMAMAETVAYTDGADASNIDQLRSLGNYPQLPAALRKDLKGEGLTIAVMDQFNDKNGEIKTLKDANEWPKESVETPDKVTLVGPAGKAFGSGGVKHGNAVVEIIYDLAPAAKYRIYDAGATADWVSGIQDAANLDAQNRPLGEPRAQIITASQGQFLSAPGDGSAGNGIGKGLYEAIAAAKLNGVLVVNAAGNHAQRHWDGQSTAGAVANTLQDFVVGNVDANGAAVADNVNVININLGLPAQFSQCTPVGVYDAALANELAINVLLGWNDWSSANNLTDADYRLELVRWADAVTRREGNWWTGYRDVVVTPAQWVEASRSDNAQNGGAGQLPVEQVAIVPAANTATTRCAGAFNAAKVAGGGIFGIRIVRKTANASNFLRLISSQYSFQYGELERSLLHPADSASVVTVAALDAATSNLESYSSRGPVLAAGGARPNGQDAANQKPDMGSFANVDTVSYGNVAGSKFNGTSSAAPHVAALALLGLQHQRQLTNATVPAALPANATAQQKADRVTQLRARNVGLADATYDALVYVSGTGGNDLGAAGFDSSFGNGRLKFHANSESCFLAAAYDPQYRSLLPAQASPLPAGQKSYDQLRTDNSATCSKQ
ncbi:S8 family serine peptidase [Pseudomonas sp. CGJS7]|uniref:S8 family serine peptidase n=1 Tax=Pseudomonas sp. CGJS7 TaxID=3109348 RepID=UPI003008B850